MRCRGLLLGGMLAALVVLAVTLAAQAAGPSEPTKPAKKPASAGKTGTSVQARPRKPAAAGATVSSRPRAAAQGLQADGAATPAAAEPVAPKPLDAAHASALQSAAAVRAAASQAVPASQPVVTATRPSLPPAARPQPARPARKDVRQALQAPRPVAAGAPAATRRISLGQATLLGIVEGLTEYLPVSSTGHLILAGYWMGLTNQTDQPGVLGGHRLEKAPAIDAFEIVIQLGAILAVLGLYRGRVGQMARGLLGHNEQGLRLAGYLFVAFLPAAVVGLALHHRIEENLFGPMPVVVALAVGGVLMIVVEHCFWTRRKARLHEAAQTRSMMPVGIDRSGGSGPVVSLQAVPRAGSHFTRVDTMLLWQALAIGIAQCLSLWPGTSRSMVTILAGLVVGLDMVAAAEFSFLLALPTLGAATLYSLAKHHEELMASAGIGGLLVGLVVSGIVAALAVKWFVAWLTRRGLLPFGVYRIVIALVLMLYFLR